MNVVAEGPVRDLLAAFARENGMRRFVVLCDANVASYAVHTTRQIRGRLDVLPFVLGERRKTLAMVQHVLRGLANCGADRTTTIVGVGGGVACDLFGLAAALFMRGVPYVHVATTLVAMADAAIGGKNGVNLPEGKNLAGTFRLSRAVFSDPAALRTLPYRHLREGLAEILKAAVIAGGSLFDALETLAPHPFSKWPWHAIVSQAQDVKLRIVAEDPLEAGSREVLNLGHTFGHAIERASRYRVSHGAAVSIGLRGAGLLALQTGRFSKEEHLRVLALLMLLGLPGVSRSRPCEVLDAMRYDKKTRQGKLRFVLPRAIGKVETGVKAADRAVLAVLERLALRPGEEEFR